ncbi:hypothetical protein GE061_004082 [Apolygus lucorum]|uniref:Fe2OG dioxygenase domain-containing protein n=1 Tax=Apolygus lucorum TaxID=248454 RepID=A0A8S9WY95_APOLU|nr:hypothetical protein GE061_004082 [Apolygus lucorum]
MQIIGNTFHLIWQLSNYNVHLQFQTDGYLVIEDFLTNEEVAKLRKAGVSLAENIPPEEQKVVFSTKQTNQYNGSYFLESGDKIRYFYETEALDDKGNLKTDAAQALNKVGHALHWLHPDFKQVSFSRKVQELCRALQLDDPVIVQSMYIYKNPKIGGEVVPHQDSTYLYTEPNTLIGLWFPLDDCSAENGCLSFIPGSHTSGTHRRMMRSNDPESEGPIVFDRPPVLYPSSSFTPCPVPKGSCVVIHGDVVHKSDQNRSSLPRHAYTFHVMDVASKFSPDNWLQSPVGFPLLYSD